MKFSGSLSAQQFLDQHWQKKSLLLSGGIDFELPELSADELGWLATLDDVESRLVFTERSDDKTTYRLKSGPFSAEELENLPQADWTLLVQDVEKHLPDFRAYFELANFVPDWRIDDLMISFAAPGGSVGPHLDNYDVFLCQGIGSRHWRLAQPGQVASAEQESGLSLLQEFSDDTPVIAAAGDILYLPPGVPHWGVARNACTTYSIGMRAPTRFELRQQLHVSMTTGATKDEDVFYADSDLMAEEAEPGRISNLSIARIRSVLGDAEHFADNELAGALGRTVTSLKAWLTPVIDTRSDLSSFLHSIAPDAILQVHGMTRMAYFVSSDGALVFANGKSRTIRPDLVPTIQSLCERRMISGHGLQRTDAGSELLKWFIETGVFDLWYTDE